MRARLKTLKVILFRRALRSVLLLLLLGAACASSPRPSPEQAAALGRSAEAEQAPVSRQTSTQDLIARANAALDEGLASKEPGVQGEALGALGASARSDALARLSEALHAEQGEIRHAAARGMFYLHAPTAAAALLEAFQKEKGWSVKKELARAAAACGARALIPELEKALVDPSPDLRAAAAFALQDLGDPAGGTALAALGNPERRGALKKGDDRWSRKVLAGAMEGDKVLAAKVLAQVGAREDVALLAPHLAAPEIPLRVWAAAAVLNLSRPNRH